MFTWFSKRIFIRQWFCKLSWNQCWSPKKFSVSRSSIPKMATFRPLCAEKVIFSDKTFLYISIHISLRFHVMWRHYNGTFHNVGILHDGKPNKILLTFVACFLGAKSPNMLAVRRFQIFYGKSGWRHHVSRRRKRWRHLVVCGTTGYCRLNNPPKSQSGSRIQSLAPQSGALSRLAFRDFHPIQL